MSYFKLGFIIFKNSFPMIQDDRLRYIRTASKSGRKRTKLEAVSLNTFLSSCIRINFEIQSIWKSLEQTEDVSEFSYVSHIIGKELDGFIESHEVSSNFHWDEWNQFEILLSEWKSVLLDRDLTRKLNSRRGRNRLIRFNNRIYQEYNRIIGFKVERELEPFEDCLKFIRTDEGKQIWKQEFGHKGMILVPWSSFIEILSKYVEGGVILKEEEELLKSVILGIMDEPVTPKAFGDFLRSFGPLEKCIQNVKQICANSWFHGFVSPEEAKILLTDRCKGTFLVRFSRSLTSSFALEYVLEVGNIQTLLIYCDMPNGVHITDTNVTKKFLSKS